MPQNVPYMQPVPYISEKSRKIAMQKRPQSSHQAVHTRLYKQDLQKNKIALAKQQEEE